jgi:hypothetical protein
MSSLQGQNWRRAGSGLGLFQPPTSVCRTARRHRRVAAGPPSATQKWLQRFQRHAKNRCIGQVHGTDDPRQLIGRDFLAHHHHHHRHILPFNLLIALLPEIRSCDPLDSGPRDWESLRWALEHSNRRLAITTEYAGLTNSRTEISPPLPPYTAKGGIEPVREKMHCALNRAKLLEFSSAGFRSLRFMPIELAVLTRV